MVLWYPSHLGTVVTVVVILGERDSIGVKWVCG